ncbi:MAG: peroxiredoxin family protein [Planctomycetota bacterium]
MYPHERSLVKRLAGTPFALLGINSDADREELKKVLEKESITWRSWWDGGGTRGPIATTWNVSGWPTIYVLDQKGVIRFKNVRGKALDEAVNTLLEEMGIAVPEAEDEDAEEEAEVSL